MPEPVASPGWQPPPQPLPPPFSLPPRPRRRWPIAAGFTAVAVVAATIATVITAQVASRGGSGRAYPPATVTVTATPPAPPKPPSLPTADADRRTCQAWWAAGDKIHAASDAQAVIPKDMTVMDPPVRENPEWTAAVHKAADFYDQAGDTLAAGIAPGTTIILARAATTAAAALRTLSTAYGTFDVANGNAYVVMRETADEMDVLCERLAPR